VLPLKKMIAITEKADEFKPGLNEFMKRRYFCADLQNADGTHE
jgi:hypothetical protein